jgi:Sulfotransferase family
MTAAETAPIFIGGLSGSGKTQLRIVLGAHPDISLTRRTRMWDRFYARFGDLREPANLDRCLATMHRDPGVQQLAPDERRVRRELADGPRTYARLFGLLHQHHAERAGKRRWGDQLGFVERFADPIFAAYPSARMIHMVRDPRHRSLPSGRRLDFSARLGWQTAMWLQSAELAIYNQRRYPGGYLILSYEAFATHPVETAEAACSFIGEPFLPPMANALRTLALDACHGARVAPAIWGLRAPHAAFLDRYAGSQMATFGYRRSSAPLTRRDRLAFGLSTWPLNRLSMAAWRTLGTRATTADARWA